ncbi:hypothetical protein EVAR_74945_1 [Eumeta japonica]|uniref:Uncharacterized protein n=1 Tax=Eumeta variegata TaxID=151549 RepID=A0A4C1UI68_EUMVA|nr:hypothetical protein EVAR_74945_1 [Eumeta japonica]
MSNKHHYTVNDDLYGTIVRTHSNLKPRTGYSEVYEAVEGLDRALLSSPNEFLKGINIARVFGRRDVSPAVSNVDRYLCGILEHALLADLQNSINPGGRVGSPGGRTSSPGARTGSPGARTSSPIGRGGSPGRLSSPGGSLSSPTSTGYGSINGSKNITADYQKPASPTYQNSSMLHEKIVPMNYAGSQSYGSPGVGWRVGSGGRGNLSELDTLLDDLSNARYGSYESKSPVFNDRIGEYARSFQSLNVLCYMPPPLDFDKALSCATYPKRWSTTFTKSSVHLVKTVPRCGIQFVVAIWNLFF